MNEKNEKKENYKETLNLPNTAFSMKANLPEREPIILKKWEEMDLYQALLEKNKDKPKFILADGPPYANGNIHLGHAVNKILKDIVIKSKILSGLSAPYVPGWDCHGLPIELNVEKEIGKSNDRKVDAKIFRAHCRAYALKQMEAQRASFIRLGVVGDWKHPYMTMDYRYEAGIIRSLATIVRNGHLHKGFKPVHWCIDCGSALAEAEVEYQDKTSPAIDVSFFVKEQSKLPFKSQVTSPVALVIWTTTPWTLPANEAVAVHPQYQYSLIHLKSSDIFIIVASDLAETLLKNSGATAYEVVDHCLGQQLEGILLHHPFYSRSVPVVLSDHVTLEAGTGCVHTAPAHGPDDYEVGLRYQLPLENPVGANGCFIASLPLFGGEHVLKANEKIITVLKEQGCLLHQAQLTHSYPHCWRHKTALIFRATQQWFVSMDKQQLRAKAIAAIKNVKWMPAWGEARLEGMISGRPDWCISRQRTWGTPLAIFTHRETGELHPDTPVLMEAVAKKVELEGIDAWFDLDPKELLKEEAAHYEKSLDTIDVWFDSGVSHDCVLEKRPELEFPADLYLEGSDQHRGWFQSSLLTSVAMKSAAPYRQVLTHGFTVDTQGRKMSKHLGNVIAPEKIIKTLGADILRLWIAATDYRTEMALSDEILKRTSDAYRRIRNTARFLLANLNGFDPARDLLSSDKLLALDSWIVRHTENLQQEIIQAFNDYHFHTIYQKLQHFCSIDLGSFYLDVIKDRQYTGKTDGIPRRSAQTALYHIVQALVRWMAPILSFTAEEIWEYLPGKEGSSVFFSAWYSGFPEFSKEKQGEELNDLSQESYWQEILIIRNAVNKGLEEARAAGQIGSGLEAEVFLYCSASLYASLSKLEDELRFVLITSQAKVEMESKRPKEAVETGVSGLWLEVRSTQQEKCVRCWHHREDVNKDRDFPGLCGRCVENVEGIGEIRQYV